MAEQFSTHAQLAQELAQQFSAMPSVEAVAVGGSLASGSGDAKSDIDLYVYSPVVIPLSQRQAIAARRGAARADLNLQFWDLGDEWFDAPTGIEVDVIYWEPAWIEGQLNRVLQQHQASMGYSTCFWHTIRCSRVMYDPHGWFARLQQQSEQPYPEALRLDIIAKNHAVLRRVIPGYAGQIEKAARRGDLVSINHRVAALLASYFDVLFALNRVLHPGEKRLVAFTLAQCARVPANLPAEVDAVLQACTANEAVLMPRVHQLLDHLDELLQSEGFDPTTSLPRAAS